MSGHRWQQVWDVAALRSAPALLRDAAFDEAGLELPPAPEGEEIVTLRQQPNTAKGTIFISLEDETGVVPMICWKRLRKKQRKPAAGFTADRGPWDVAAGR